MSPLKILALPADQLSIRVLFSHYRIVLPLACLKEQGHDVTFIRAGDNIDFAGIHNPAQYDVIVGQRTSGIAISQWWQKLAAVPDRNYVLIYEIDDLLFVKGAIPKTNYAAWLYFDQDPECMKRIRDNMAVSDLVTTTTEQLADYVHPINPHTAILPNYIDKAVLGVSRQAADGFVVVAPTSPSHLGDWDWSGKSIGRFIKQSGASIHFVGSCFDRQLSVSIPDQIFVTPWVHIPRYYESLIGDVAVAPLSPTNGLNECKSSLKVLEAMALGLPIVAADTETYRGVIKHGFNGFLARKNEFDRYLWQLFNYPELRDEIAVNGRDYVRDNYLIQDNAYRWSDAYNAIIK